MKAILLSIKPKYADKILAGEKKFEYRRVRCQFPIERIFIYVTNPVKRIIGEVIVEEILEGSPKILWELTKDYAGISKTSYLDYFSGKSTAYAYKLGKATEYSHAKKLGDYGIEKAPQSFVYLNV